MVMGNCNRGKDILRSPNTQLPMVQTYPGQLLNIENQAIKGFIIAKIAYFYNNYLKPKIQDYAKKLQITARLAFPATARSYVPKFDGWRLALQLHR